MKSRIFNIVQYEVHPKTKEPLLNEETIKQALQHKSLKKWAYIAHDKDMYSESDPNHAAGTLKPKHWHIVIQSNVALDLSMVAKWFGISENYIDTPKGRGAFLDCVQYLTHEGEKQKQLGKHLYEDECVKANFDFRAEIDKAEEQKFRCGKNISPAKQMMYEVMYDGKTLRECEKDNPLLYMENLDKLKKYRLDYISRREPPASRINYYLYGKGGVGKDLMSRTLARALFPQYEDDDDIFFTVGAGNVLFDGYDGQPVIIWSDRRAAGLIKALGGRENVFNVFDTHPTKQRQNIKYGSVNLCNVVNIVNGQETYLEFLDGIAGEYIDRDGEQHKAEDKGQSYRRFPFIIPLHDSDFDLLINKGYYLNDRRLFEEFYEYRGITGNMQRIVEMCGGENESQRKIGSKVVQPIVNKHYELLDKQNTEVIENEILVTAIMEGWGKQSYTEGCDILEGYNTKDFLTADGKPDEAKVRAYWEYEGEL